MRWQPKARELRFARGRWWQEEEGQGLFDWAARDPVRRHAWSRYAWEQFEPTVPEEIRAQVRRIDTDWFSAVRLYQQAPAVFLLAADDPWLVVALARHWEFPGVGRKDWDGVRRQVGRKRHEQNSQKNIRPPEGRSDFVAANPGEVGPTGRMFHSPECEIFGLIDRPRRIVLTSAKFTPVGFLR